MPRPYAAAVARLESDVADTLGESYRYLVRDAAANLGRLDIDHDDEKLVEDVQQAVHDEFIDTSWPRCPRHAGHPLWYREDAWWCEQDRVPIARLGELRPAIGPAV